MIQNDALELLKMGHNVYLTGQAGSGKTFVLNAYIKYLKEHGIGVGVTASTGIAATHMNGTTIHSFAGIGIKDYLSEWDLDEIEQKKDLFKRFEKTSVLIIDEVSMLHAFRLDMVDTVCRRLKRADVPFGGMQVILSGDFFQLPPVTRGEEKGDMVYRAKAWKEMNLKVCYLHEQFRQADPEFTSILNEIRANNISEVSRALLKSRFNADIAPSIRPTKLYSHNIDVDAVNAMELEKIPGTIRTYSMKHKGSPRLVDGLIKSCLSPELLVLKKGAQVMFVKNNYEKGYVNGTRGVVVDFSTDIAKTPIVEIADGRRILAESETWVVEDNGKIKAEIHQIPLRLAWAITVHKSQGLSLDAAEMDLSKVFVRGQGYVALSRVRALSGLSLLGINDLALSVDPMVLAVDKRLQELSRAAEGYLASLASDEKKDYHKKFILHAGGSEDVVAVIDETTGDFVDAPKEPKVSTVEKTRLMLIDKKSMEEMVKERELKQGTIIEHIEKILEKDPKFDIEYLVSKDKETQTRLNTALKAFAKMGGDGKLSPVKEYLEQSGYDFTFDELKLFRLFFKHEKKEKKGKK